MAPALEQLSALRHDVQQFCRRRNDSIWRFYDGDHGWFRLSLDSRPVDTVEDAESAGEPSDPKKNVEHLTTTITSLEALAEAALTDAQIDARSRTANRGAGIPTLADINALDSPDNADDVRAVLRSRAVVRRFVELALQNPQDWRSDGAAYVYCRVRTIGAASRLLDADDVVFARNRKNLRKLVEQAWNSHAPDPTWGLRESTTDPNERSAQASRQDDVSQAHVPNSFLTYWGLLALELPRTVSAGQTNTMRAAALHWLEKSLAQQVAFHYAQSRSADPQQLAWALCGHVNFGDDEKLAAKTTVEYTELEAGLRAFFAQAAPRRRLAERSTTLLLSPCRQRVLLRLRDSRRAAQPRHPGGPPVPGPARGTAPILRQAGKRIPARGPHPTEADTRRR